MPVSSNTELAKRGVVITRVTEMDIPQIIQLNRIALPENYSTDFFMEILRRYGDLFFVAKSNDDVVGYVMCRQEFFNNGHVISLAVHPNYRRTGIATALMNSVHEAMVKLGLGRSYLEVRVTNDVGISLYEKLGYRRVRVIPSYYADGTDGIFMEISFREGHESGTKRVF